MVYFSFGKRVLQDKGFDVSNANDPSLYYHNDYLKSSLQLAKSIVIKHKTQADKMNDYLAGVNKNFSASSNPSEWKYFKNINGLKYNSFYYQDQPVMVKSLDSGEIFELTKTSIQLHPYTKKDLLLFEKTYEDLIEQYPFQDTYIKACILDSNIDTAVTVNIKDFRIVLYNKKLIESQEDNLIFELQDWINNYKVTWFFEQYALSDTLFTAAQLAIFYEALFLKILAIRLKNAKTIRAHSYHIYSYLSSNKYIDEEFLRLNFKQRFFFYRNILYLNNHIGHNKTFDELIKILFDEAKMAVSAIDYRQLKELDSDNYVKYNFAKRPLNHITIDQDSSPYSLETLSNSEYTLAPSNPTYWKYIFNEADSKFKNVIRDTLYTKDIVSVFYNYTDNVEYPLFETIVNTWAYFNQTNRARFIVRVNNIIDNTSNLLSSKDAFKLFIYILYKYNGLTLTQWPTVYISHVIKDTLPSNEELLSLCYNPKKYYPNELNDIRIHFPQYSNAISTEAFYNYTFAVYLYNITLWIYKSNQHTIDENGQFTKMIQYFFKDDIYTFDNEDIGDFLQRVNFSNISQASNSQLYNMLTKIIDTVFDNRYFDFLNYVNTQKAIISVFKKMTSYTIQITDNYVKNNPTLVKMKAALYGLYETIEEETQFVNLDNFNLEVIQSTQSQTYTIEYDKNLSLSISEGIDESSYEIFFNTDILSVAEISNTIDVFQSLNVEVEVLEAIGTEVTEDSLEFLILNQNKI